MRVVFLDFDNVLNDDNTKDWIKPGPGLFVDGHIGLDREKVELLNRLVADDVRFVFSTSWRKWYKDEELLKILQARGFKGKIHETSPRTPLRFSYTSRESQIREWLDDERYDGNLPESFVVLDDLYTAYADVTCDRHVETDSELGLNEERVERAKKILDRQAFNNEYLLDPEPEGA